MRKQIQNFAVMAVLGFASASLMGCLDDAAGEAGEGSTGLDGETSLADLTEDEICEAIENSSEHSEDALTESEQCYIDAQWAALFAGQAGAGTGETYSDVCTAAYNDCINGDDQVVDDGAPAGADDDDADEEESDDEELEGEGASDDEDLCEGIETFDEETCSATIADIEACLQESIDEQKAAAANECEEPDASEAPTGEPELGAACSHLLEVCPDFGGDDDDDFEDGPQGGVALDDDQDLGGAEDGDTAGGDGA